MRIRLLPNAGDINRFKAGSLAVAVMGAGVSVSGCGIGIAGYLFGLFVEAAVFRKEDWIRFPHAKLVLLLFCSLVISVYTSAFLHTSMRGLFKYVEGFVLLYACMDVIRDKRAFNIFLAVLLGTYVVVALAALSQEIFGADFIRFRPVFYHHVEAGMSRLSGPFNHSNDFASFILPGVMIFGSWGIAVWMYRKKWMAVVSWAILVLLVYVLIRSMSRSAFLSLFVAFSCLAIFVRRKVYLLGGLAVILALAVWVPSPFGVRLQELLDFSAGSTPERLILIQTAGRMILANPLFGLGLNTYAKHFAEFRPDDYHDVMYAHNTYIQMASEAGIIGAVLYLAVIGVFVWELAGMIRKTEASFYRLIAMGVFAGLMGFLTNSLFESCLQSTQLRTLFWLLLGMGSVLSQRGFWTRKPS